MARSTKTTKKLASRKRRERKNIERGQVHIRSSFNNTLVTVTDRFFRILQGEHIVPENQPNVHADPAE